MLKDKSYKIQTPVTIQARELAVHLLEWCLKEANRGVVNAFVQQLTGQLQSVILSSTKKSFSYNKEKMWKQFYMLRTSADFVKSWKDFLAHVGGTPIYPVLF